MTTCEPLTLPLFDETELPLMSSAEAGLAKTSAQRARDLAWTEHAADYGSKSPEFLATFDLSGPCWRTAQTCLQSTGDVISAEFSGTWPRSGTMSNGIAYRLPPLTHPTSVIASGLWRTGEPLFPTLHGTPNPNNPRRQGPSGNELGREVNRRERELMPTLTTADNMLSPSMAKWPKHAAFQERMLPTLRATDGERGGRGELLHTMKGAPTPRGMLPTLTRADGSGGPGRPLKRTGGDNLRTAILLPTLTATRRSGLQSHGANAILGSLNPTWCEWYMGLPIGWSALEPSET